MIPVGVVKKCFFKNLHLYINYYMCINKNSTSVYKKKKLFKNLQLSINYIKTVQHCKFKDLKKTTGVDKNSTATGVD